MSKPLRLRLQAMFVAGLVLLAAGAAGCASSSDTTAPPDTTRPLPEVPRTIRIPTEEARRTGLNLDTVEAGRFDQGRMWTFEDPPAEYFEEAYDLTLDDQWLTRARLGALRIPGCTASFASPHGLMLTNHHCARSHAAAVSRPGEALLETGFYAETLGAERRVPDLYAEQLIAIEDVTGEIEQALSGAQTDAERAAARQEAVEAIRARRTQAAGGGAAIRVQVTPLYDGARYSAYTYRRYDDVRLVLIPELAVGYFGGDPDNFTYPRYTLDMALFRIYGDDGEPLETEYYFPWDEDGAAPGEAVFVVGNPGATSRLSTVAQLEYVRDVQDAALLAFLESRIAALTAFAGAQPEAGGRLDLENLIFGLQNARKLYRGRLEALRDPYIMARRADAQEAFVDALREDAALQEQYGGLVDSMAALQQEKRTLADAYRAFLLMNNPAYTSATLQRALAAYAYLQRQEAGATAGEARGELRGQVLQVESQPDALDRRLLAARLEDFQEYFGADGGLVQEVLEGRAPEAAARQIVQASVFSDSAQTAAALQSEALPEGDPALELVRAFYERYRDFRSARAALAEQQRALARRLGQARFAVYGTEVPPDATFTLRLSDGRVRGYPYNGTLAPPHTTLSGLYGHYYAYGDGTPWDLPPRWLDRWRALDLSTPLNLVSTNDITGGNSGSPLLNRDLELVGLVFDGNIQSLAGDFIFLPDRMRAVSVDVRGMLEALEEVYDAERLLLELTDGQLVEAETALR